MSSNKIAKEIYEVNKANGFWEDRLEIVKELREKI